MYTVCNMDFFQPGNLVMLLSVHYKRGSRMIFDIFEIAYLWSLMSYPHTDPGCVLCLFETTPY